ncbi:inactive leucine-rich repeat receptor-like serine/threonine-protein kinase At1g60630 [Cynara cardunculus var. scolymus]|uniref:Leucine-rich repeat-containing protein n=1 Tax=Cynara cardunculus var. scolymus TaxID=59895 RepID=A0A103XRY3_CYNCS|nr:inactive leucine-rich repeat receptor-like serine/threonine-protein kinase At1g60630 [Cynara cardunculus var. scolymus]KVH95714.1 Leucine-rich repeat-containing protein [Cynara cardunculus var. scolymus]
MKQNGVVFFLCLVSLCCECAFGGDREALLGLKSSIDPSNSLQWNGTDFCRWEGVRECLRGRVSKLVLENLNLKGTLDSGNLNQLDQIRVLSLKQNSISGEIPDLSGLPNLKSLYLSYNNFSGEFPASLTTLHRLKTIVLSGNRLSGAIPETVLNVQRLYVLYLDDNRFTGKIPPLNQTGLRYLNLSNNKLSGQIPATPVLVRFNSTSFFGNIDLCGDAFGIPCSLAPSPSFAPANPTPPTTKKSNHRRNIKIIVIIAGSIGGFLLLCILIAVLVICLKRKKQKSPDVAVKGAEAVPAAGGGGGAAATGSGKNGGGGFSSEGDDSGGGIGKLVFFGGGDQPEMSYSLEDLLKASAETLGRGTVGSTYKAVMESGFIVTVKRLKDARYPRVEEFRRHVDVIGRLRHQNLVPLRAYFQAKEERLLVYDYFPNGSLFSLIHGSRTSAGGKPLHWTSCLKIAEDLATGLLYIHQNPGLTHGNLKSSNVLLGSDFESCLTDYGLMSFRNPDFPEESSASSLFYRAPECRDMRKPLTQQADVYSFGVLLLELLTGKTPFQDLVLEHGADIPRWVKSVREEETESGDEPTSSGNEASEEKLTALLNIAMACISLVPENRPVMKEVLRMIRETRAEAAHVSSNSSDHSPGRWSDTVQSLPRDEHLSI